MDKVLVTGVDEFLGANVALALAGRCQVGGVSDRGLAPEGCRALECELTDCAALSNRLAEERPRWVVHCGPLARPSWDWAELPAPDAERELDQVKHLLLATRRCGAKLAVVSTDALFAGPRMFHGEDARPSAEGPIASAAWAVEQALAGTEALVVRTHAFGFGPAGSEANYAERLWTALSQGEACEVDAERHATPILASDLGELIYRAMQLELRGVIQIAGAERTSPFRFAAALAGACGFAGRQVRLPDGPPPRRGNVDETSLNTQFVRRQLGVPLPLLRESLSRFAEQAAGGHREKLHGGCLVGAYGQAA